jgi:DNA-binding MurR/RpiR family transcriptional regulator
MNENLSHPVARRIQAQGGNLTPKSRVLADFVLGHSRKAVFMTTKELADACGVSEATVVRFVGHLGYRGYGEFIQALRDYVDTEMTLLERAELPDMAGGASDRLWRVLTEEMDNLAQFYESADRELLERFITEMAKAQKLYVVGARLSYTFAYYLGWSLTKIRSDVRTLNGSDSTIIDQLCVADRQSAVVVIATSRYPNELIRLGRLARRCGLRLLVITDSQASPLIPFAHLALVSPSKHIPFIGTPATISCIVNYLVMELAARGGAQVAEHQQRLEQTYRENDILFNLERTDMGAI